MYISESLMNAYLTAAALHVMIAQFSFIFGIVIDFHSGPLALFYVSKSYSKLLVMLGRGSKSQL